MSEHVKPDERLMRLMDDPGDLEPLLADVGLAVVLNVLAYRVLEGLLIAWSPSGFTFTVVLLIAGAELKTLRLWLIGCIWPSRALVLRKDAARMAYAFGVEQASEVQKAALAAAHAWQEQVMAECRNVAGEIYRRGYEDGQASHG